MNPQDDVKFAEIMTVLGESVDKPPSEMKIQIYFKALADLTIEQIEAACIQVLQSKTISTFPLIGEIREAALATGGQALDSRIDHAWNKLMEAVQRHGYYDSVLFDDGIIHLILQSWGGWLQWSGVVTNDELKWARKDFDKLYRAYSGQRVLAPTEHLIGYIEHQNSLAGFPEYNGPVYLICGDKPRVVFTKALPRPEAPKQIDGGCPTSPLN